MRFWYLLHKPPGEAQKRLQTLVRACAACMHQVSKDAGSDKKEFSFSFNI